MKAPTAFQPAPRPKPLVSAEEAERLADSTRDLGFGRAVSAPDSSASPSDAPAKVATKAAEKPVAATPANDQSIKLTVSESLWDELRLAALKRRVTVRFLILEALSKSGYAVDLKNVPEDGRRIR